ncbi:hypothetical protein [Pseudonocardia endophytica]|uniref:DUF4345 domain-containing protein n=1 Tax=Pseudonocardia endophytica TaxID=401976 RepID=A0A4V6NDF9_PSEEN|nr:hypothetical protein [Pseudonocardia endophytica]TCK22686.1 hypothetical protein EV378_6694 [Pseudonocardia endophytica]
MATTVPLHPSHPVRPVRPSSVTLSVALWLGAILAGVAETFVHLSTPDAPTGPAVMVRFGVYLVLGALVLTLRTGSNAVRWTVAVVIGGVGMLSLVVEPIGYLAAGGSVGAFLATAGWADLAVAGLRSLHVLEVLVALALLFHPSSTAFFRPRTHNARYRTRR